MDLLKKARVLKEVTESEIHQNEDFSNICVSDKASPA